jgi:hypothetical protein
MDSRYIKTILRTGVTNYSGRGYSKGRRELITSSQCSFCRSTQQCGTVMQLRPERDRIESQFIVNPQI